MFALRLKAHLYRLIPTAGDQDASSGSLNPLDTLYWGVVLSDLCRLAGGDVEGAAGLVRAGGEELIAFLRRP